MENGMKTRNLGAVLMFAFWYLVQGLVSSFLLTTLYAKLLEQGMSKSQGGILLGGCALLWGLKVFFGPVVDRFHSKFWWGCITSFITAVLVLTLPLVDRMMFTVILVVVAIPNIVMALQDVTVDGLAIQVLNEKDRASTQMLMMVAAGLGMLLGGGVMMSLLARRSLEEVCTLVAILVIVAGVAMPILLKDAVRRPANRPMEEKTAAAGFWAIFKSPGIYAAIILALLWAPAQGITEPLFIGWLKEQGLSKDEMAFLFSVAPWVQILGALMGGVMLARSRSRRFAAECAVLWVAICYALLGVLPAIWPHSKEAAVMVAALTTGGADWFWKVILFSVMMDLSDRRFPATSFALLMAATNAGTAFFNFLGGYLGDRFVFGEVLLVAVVAQLFVMVPLGFVKLRVQPTLRVAGYDRRAGNG